MAENEKQAEAAKEEAPKAAEKFVHVLVLGIGAATRTVQLVTDSPKAPKVFVEFIDGFRSGKKDLIWTPTPQNPVFAIRMNSVDFYEYRAGKAEEKAA